MSTDSRMDVSPILPQETLPIPIEFQRAERVLLASGFSIRLPERADMESDEGFRERIAKATGADLLDCEGEYVARIRRDFLEKIAHVSDDTLRAILEAIGLAATAAQERGSRSGERRGRQQIIETVHELLGIDRICEAIKESRAWPR